MGKQNERSDRISTENADIPTSPTSFNTRCTHQLNPPFFTRSPVEWRITDYLSYPHPPTFTRRKILEGWKKSLVAIVSCTEGCYNDYQCLRAHQLLQQYREKDRHIARAWCDLKSSSGPETQPENEATLRKARKRQRDKAPVEPEDDDVHENASEREPETETDSTSSVPTPLSVSPSVAKAAFRRTFSSMKASSQWLLKSGRTVEAVIYSSCFSMHDDSFATSLGQSFVLDLACSTMESWFTVDEWEEICATIPPMPKPDPTFVASLRRFFSVKTTGQLEQVLRQTSYLPEGEEYDRERHFNSRWADTVIRSILTLYEAPDEPLQAPHLEDWYTSYLWSPIIDQCFLSLRGMTIERKESICRATSTRKNRHRTLSRPSSSASSLTPATPTSSTPTNNRRKNPRPTPTRLKSGPRLDGIIKTIEDNSFEYGGMEVARTFSGGLTSTKYLTDAYKLCKTLRDMLYRLHEHVEHEEAVVANLQVVGIVNAGLALQVLRMIHPKGYVCVLSREKTLTVPTGVGDLYALLKVLTEVTRMKKVVEEVRVWAASRAERLQEEDMYKKLIDGAPDPVRTLFWAADTP